MSVNEGPGPQVRTGTGLSVLGKNEKQYRNSTKSIDKNRDKIADNRKNGKEKQRNSKKLTGNQQKIAKNQSRICSYDSLSSMTEEGFTVRAPGILSEKS